MAYIECQTEDGDLLDSEAKILDLIGLCGEAGIHCLMVDEEVLPDGFFDLHTGLAGIILQKLVNYSVKTAFVISEKRIGSGRFYEMTIESNRGKQFHFGREREKAEKWLLEE